MPIKWPRLRSGNRIVTTTCPRLLIVDDDPEIRSLLQRYLAAQALTVDTACNGAQMRAVLARQAIDLVLLDLGLPGEDGLALMRELRATWHGAVIIVTGRGAPVDRVVGLEVGADDYVTKPFDLRELLARIHSVLRRTGRGMAADGPAATRRFRIGPFTLDRATRELSIDGRPIALTTGEYALLDAFVARPNRVLSRDELMEHLHRRDAGPLDRAIDMQIGRLRRKIEADPGNPVLIKSVRGAGYLLAARVTREED